MASNERIRRVESPVIIEKARIIYRNFAGEKRRFNQQGDRNFHVVIEDEKVAAMLLRDGWRVKQFKPKDDDEETMPGYHLEVKVNFESSQPPKVIMVTNKTGVVLTEETISLLDSADILTCDVEIRPYNWGPDDNGNYGVKGYLKTLYATIKADPFSERYADIKLTNDPLAGLKDPQEEE